YNHNDHYSRLLLREVPTPCSTALDVGCGEGRFAAKLTDVCTSVMAIDPDVESINSARHNSGDRLTLIQGDFLEHDFGDRHFDFISAIASIHHMPFRQALQRMATLLSPGGVLSVLGLYQEVTMFDRLAALTAVPINATLAWTRQSAPMAAPAIEPTMTLTSAAPEAPKPLPGSPPRPLLLWPYLLPWKKPRSYPPPLGAPPAAQTSLKRRPTQSRPAIRHSIVRSASPPFG